MKIVQEVQTILKLLDMKSLIYSLILTNMAMRFMNNSKIVGSEIIYSLILTNMAMHFIGKQKTTLAENYNWRFQAKKIKENYNWR